VIARDAEELICCGEGGELVCCGEGGVLD